MLIISRRVGESLHFQLDPSIDPNTPVGEILSEPIVIKLNQMKRAQIALAISAPDEIQVIREELV